MFEVGSSIVLKEAIIAERKKKGEGGRTKRANKRDGAERIE